MAAGLVAMIALVVTWLLLREDGFEQAPTRGADVRTLTIESEAAGRSLDTSLVVPASGGSGRPLLVFLHGRGNDERSYLEYESLFAELAALGPAAPVIALPYGGESSYWHDREDGDWARYVTAEVLPEALDATGADPARVALGGISMGGFGALHIAALHPGRFCAVGGHSPAVWAQAGETAPGAFDDAEDFERSDVIGAAATGAFAGTPVWIDVGAEDPFLPGAEALADALAATGDQASLKVWPGGHESGYWESHFPAYLRFYAARLARCRR